MRYIYLFLVALLIWSCNETNVQTQENTVISEIANSDEYYKLRENRQKILQGILNKDFNANDLFDEIKNDVSFESFCDMDISSYKSKGAALYKAINCDLEKSLISLKEKYPEYNNLSSEQRVELEKTFNHLGKLKDIKIPDYEK